MKADEKPSFLSPRTRFTIGSLDDTELDDVTASFNPKELQYDRSVPWSPHPKAELEYGGTQGRSLSVELLFDGFELNKSVAPQVDLLEKLARPVIEGSKHADENRPHYCLALWGSAGLPRLLCVIESVSTKYTLFSAMGMPLRATCVVKLKEATVFNRKVGAGRDRRVSAADQAAKGMTERTSVANPGWFRAPAKG